MVGKDAVLVSWRGLVYDAGFLYRPGRNPWPQGPGRGVCISGRLRVSPPMADVGNNAGGPRPLSGFCDA